MKRFIRKIVLFPIGLIISYVLIYFCYSAYLNHRFNHTNAVFIWGDSQAYYGIDIKELSNTLERKVYTAANPGAGVYDFLVFTEQVPKNAVVIVSISKLVQIRRKENDFNRGGLSLWALRKLYNNGYTLNEIGSIIKLNLKPRSHIAESTNLFNYSDSMEIGLPISHFKNYYSQVPSFLNQKQNLYLIGIENLIKKNCKIAFLELPYHSKLKNIESQSQIKKKTEDLKYEIGSLFKEFTIDTVKLDRNRNVFKDLSHLNSVGAQDLSEKLGLKLLKDEKTTMYIAY